MYLQYYALTFLLFCIIDKGNWFTWALLSAMCLLLKCNAALFDVTLDARYIFRCCIIFVFAYFLMAEYTKTSGYQSFILFLFLLTNLLMLNNKSLDNYFYVNFEAITYGLVACQFTAIIPRLWCCISDWSSSYFSSKKDKQLVDRI